MHSRISGRVTTREPGRAGRGAARSSWRTRLTAFIGTFSLAVGTMLLPGGAAAAVSQAAPAVAASSDAAPPDLRWTFEYTGAAAIWTVPEGVNHVTITAIGAGGQRGHRFGGGIERAAPGYGGMARAVFAVTPGEALTVWVGGAGEGSHWGFGCGGRHGVGEVRGGDGGGASAVTRGAFTPAEGSCEQEDRPARDAVLIVGGGGGGGGGHGYVDSDDIHAGGDGGKPAAPGKQPDYQEAGCGGCESDYKGASGHAGVTVAGGGGGGGGWHAGGGGGSGPSLNGGGGGGGLSYVAPTPSATVFANGVERGDGSVTIVGGETVIFDTCAEAEETVTAPDGTGLVRVHAEGAAGGVFESENIAPPGFGGTLTAFYPLSAGQTLTLGVGCAGGNHGGWGPDGMAGGNRGIGHSVFGSSGGGGGGASGVWMDGTALVIAGGGGGGGGHADSDGGDGGNGGLFAEDGERGDNQLGKRAKGGCGGCIAGPGKKGHAASVASGGGGGGGGGGGFLSGDGGDGGPPLEGSGAGGGGGSTNWSGEHPAPLGAPVLGTSLLTGDGLVELTWLPDVPASVIPTGGGKQRTGAGTAFADPLAVKVVDGFGTPMPNTEVHFSTGTDSDHHGVFDGGGVSHTATTDASGVATSPTVWATDASGAWEASASVGDIVTHFALSNTRAASAAHTSVSPHTPLVGSEITTFGTVRPAAEHSIVHPAAGTAVTFDLGDGRTMDASLADRGSLPPQATATYKPDPTVRSTWLMPGTHTSTFHYPGDDDFRLSEAKAVFTVVKVQPTMTVASSANPAGVGEQVSFTATVSVPDGAPLPIWSTVAFEVDGTSVGSAPVGSDGTAVLADAFTADTAGAYKVTATLPGGAAFDGAHAAVTQVVGPDPTVVTASASPHPSVYGDPVTYSASVTAPGSTLTPTGTVEFFALLDDVPVELCGATPLDASGAAECTSSTFLPPGSHEAFAVYEPASDDFDAGQGWFTAAVQRAPVTMTVSATPDDAAFGEQVILHAGLDWGAVPPDDEAATVQFYVDGVAAGAAVPITTETSVSSAPVSDLAAGLHTISAVYSGSDLFDAASAHGTVFVAPATTTTTVTSAPDPSAPQEAVSFVATVTTGAGAPDGTVRFRVDGTVVGESPVDGAGVALSPAIDTLTPGAHAVEAIFEPADADHLGSTGETTHRVKEPTTTILGASPEPASFGEPVEVTATVIRDDGHGPVAGSVDFAVDGTPVGACQGVVLEAHGAAAQASCELTGLSGGAHTITATYSGETLIMPSSATLTAHVEPAVTTTNITSSANPSASGQPVTFTATVTQPLLGAAPVSGEVQFQVDGVDLGAPIGLDASGTATSEAIAPPVGSHEVTATLLATPDYATSSDTLTQTVTKAVTGTSVSSSMNPSETGDAPRFTATVAVLSPGAGVPTGTVQFQLDGADLGAPVALDGSGMAESPPAADLQPGSYRVTASYAGSADFSASTGALTQTVGAGATATTVTASPQHVTPYGQGVVFTAEVSVRPPAAGTPTGRIQFFLDGQPLGAPVRLVDGTASTDPVTRMAAGEHEVLAQFWADAGYTDSSGETRHTVGAAPTATSVTADVEPSLFGEPVTFTAQVTSPSPGAPTVDSGTVRFEVGGEALGDPVPVDATGAAVSPPVSDLPVGTHQVTASFLGSDDFTASAGEVTQHVQVAASTTTVTTSHTSAAYGTPVTFTATVAPVAPSQAQPEGTVEFLIDGALVGEAELVGGIATSLPVDDLDAGTHTVTAVYGGDTEVTGSSGEVVQTITAATTTAELTSSVNPSAFGQEVQFTATVTAEPHAASPARSGATLTLAAPAALAAVTGTVQFFVDGEPLGPAQDLTGGSATSPPVSTLSVGTHMISVQFTGANYVDSSASLSQAVRALASTTELTSSANPSHVGDDVVFTAVVTSSGTAPPTGSVRFLVDGVALGAPVALIDGTARTAPVTTLAAGEHQVVAEYSGDADHAPSTASIAQTVDEPAPPLPPTGGVLNPWVAAAGALVLLAGIAAVLIGTRRARRHRSQSGAQ